MNLKLIRIEKAFHGKILLRSSDWHFKDMLIIHLFNNLLFINLKHEMVMPEFLIVKQIYKQDVVAYEAALDVWFLKALDRNSVVV